MVKIVNMEKDYMSEHDEDRASSHVNETILEQEFNLDTSAERSADIEAINEMRKQLMIAGQDTDPDVILLSNIDRANTLLDTAQTAIENGAENAARMYEVSAQLINAITSAASSVQNSTFGMQKHDYNMKVIEVKRQELIVKQAIAQGKLDGSRGNGDGNTVMVMSREQLLNMIEQEETAVEVEGVTEETNPDQE
jgi:hypothetical protein